MGIHNQPNFRKRDNALDLDLGKSRTAFWESEATIPQDHPIYLKRVQAATTVNLPGHTALRGEIVVFNNSSVAVTGVTVSDDGVTVADVGNVPANGTVSVRVADTYKNVPRSEHAVEVVSGVYPTREQGDLHVVFYVRDYPHVADATAMS